MMPVMPLVPVPSREQAPILVVDDDPKILALVRTYLERERYRVSPPPTGASALARDRASSPRLVVLDLMIPEIDGLAVIRRARLDWATCRSSCCRRGARSATGS